MGFLRTEIEEKSEPKLDPDLELVEQSLSGDTEAFRELILKYQEQVYRVVLRQVRNDAIARDLAQECFLKVFRHLSTFRFEASFKTWLLKVSMNVVRTHFASRSYREQLQTSSLASQDEEVAQPADSLDLDALQQLSDAIASLPTELREIIVLCGVEQYTYEEAAVVLEIPVGTVRSRLHRARMKLRDQYFVKEGEDHG